ncbi:hypothetical protein J4G48_0048665 (plasmid) [Bradyrhizobium barranii subsp. apii]|uniref:hypothetical protein n=1 Tax=Bradyrhizobium barranii TaxID=2992140 RepID=UPI001AA1242E|nr:hypothetical protein [Bradyrhizobium barranii]UPU01522.1 hypothetical protein J4G48_0048665 [Bradyrhizobium barranii subsp. apii]
MPNAYTRLVVPDSLTSPLTESTYLRLGSYSDEEAKLVTGITTTISESPHESDNAGLLAFTNHDCQANVEGAALLKIGRGQTTEVANGNSLHRVAKGTYEMAAENGVSISAGANGTHADVILTASNSVKLINNGDKIDRTGGNSEKRVMGTTKEYYKGQRYTCMSGLAITLTMGLNVSVFLGATTTIKAGRDYSISLGGQVSLTTGAKFEFVYGCDTKIVAGDTSRLLLGLDFKSAVSDTKILSNSDFKLAPVEDLKVVGRDVKTCETSVSVTNEDVCQGTISTEQYELVNRAAEISSSTGDKEVIQKNSVVIL